MRIAKHYCVVLHTRHKIETAVGKQILNPVWNQLSNQLWNRLRTLQQESLIGPILSKIRDSK